MPCGVYTISGIPDNKIGEVEAEADLDTPDKISKERQPDGSWTLTMVFPPCEGGSDPLQKKTLGSDQYSIIGRAPSGPAAFIQSYLQVARDIKRKYRIPIAVLLAQAGLETGWGRSVVGNAYFGIKAEAGQASVTTKTHEFRGGQRVVETDAFRSYSGFEDAAEDYGRFLTGNQRYHAAFAHTDNPEAFARSVAEAGYATDPDYGTKLVGIMRGNGLEDYDRV